MQEIITEIEQLRKLRGFDASQYLSAKLEAINKFFREENRDAAVVGLSGGIDSTLVLALLNKAKEQANSPIKKVVALIVPICSIGATGQSEGEDKAAQYCVNKNFDCRVINASYPFNILVASCQVRGEKFSAWVHGQMLSVFRTPIFYGYAAVLQDEGYKSIVVGTTNKSEFSIGFYGKASDGMNDLQPILDIYKSEVYQVARLLNIPEHLINQRPEGGVWDGRGDEEMIGAPYKILDEYLIAKEYRQNNSVYNFCQDEYFNGYRENIEKLIQTNIHKKKVGLPSRTINTI